MIQLLWLKEKLHETNTRKEYKGEIKNMETMVRCPECGKLLKVTVVDEPKKITISKRVRSESMFADLAKQIEDGTSGLHVGDEITFTLTNGEEATIIVMDTKVFGTGHMVFRFKDALLKSEQMNETDINESGYAASKMFKRMEECLSLLPEDLLSVIKTRTIKEKLSNGEISTCEAKLWLLSKTEVGRESESDVDNVRFELFKDELSRICQVDGETVWHWLRSANYGGITGFYNVGSGGNVGYSGASGWGAVCPCFLI